MKFALACLVALCLATLFAPSAYAQYDTGGGMETWGLPPFLGDLNCNSFTTSADCLDAMSSPWWCFWCPKSKTDCSLIGRNSCTTCKLGCDCTFTNTTTDPACGQACQEVAISERNACYGNCYIDFEDAC